MNKWKFVLSIDDRELDGSGGGSRETKREREKERGREGE